MVHFAAPDIGDLRVGDPALDAGDLVGDFHEIVMPEIRAFVDEVINSFRHRNEAISINHDDISNDILYDAYISGLIGFHQVTEVWAHTPVASTSFSPIFEALDIGIKAITPDAIKDRGPYPLNDILEAIQIASGLRTGKDNKIEALKKADRENEAQEERENEALTQVVQKNTRNVPTPEKANMMNRKGVGTQVAEQKIVVNEPSFQLAGQPGDRKFTYSA